MNQRGKKIKTLINLLIGLAIAIILIGESVRLDRGHSEAVALAPRYQADCAQVKLYSAASPTAPCYDFRTYVNLTATTSKKTHFLATLTLPSGKEVTTQLQNTGWSARIKPLSGLYGVEVWQGDVTQIDINGQEIITRDSPLWKASKDYRIIIVMFGVVGIGVGFAVIIGIVLFVKSFFGNSASSMV